VTRISLDLQMQRQAENVHRVLVSEKVKELFIVAHSMSGPIAALTLIDLCKDSGITVKSLVRLFPQS